MAKKKKKKKTNKIGGRDQLVKEFFFTLIFFS
jgi:hypothetical protein